MGKKPKKVITFLTVFDGFTPVLNVAETALLRASECQRTDNLGFVSDVYRET